MIKLTFDPKADRLCVLFSDKPVARRAEDKPGVVFCYDKEDELIEVEILSLSKRMKDSWAVDIDLYTQEQVLDLQQEIMSKQLDWQTASPEEIIAQIRASRVGWTPK